MLKITSLLALAVAALFPWQDPKPSKKPAKTPAAQQPAKQAGKPAQAVAGQPKPNPLEGVYKLRSRVVQGLAGNGSNRGYLVITGRHLFLSLASKGTSDKHPLVHASVREWRMADDGMHMTAKLDYFSDNRGVITMTPEGKQEVRVIQVVRGGVRVLQGDQTWLEFERVE